MRRPRARIRQCITYLGHQEEPVSTLVEASLDGKSFVTARGWDDLSDMMGVFERLGKPVGLDLIVQYVQNETIAREFAAYYDLFNKYRDDYRIDDVLAGAERPADVIERASQAEFDERLSVVGLFAGCRVRRDGRRDGGDRRAGGAARRFACREGCRGRGGRRPASRWRRPHANGPRVWIFRWPPARFRSVAGTCGSAGWKGLPPSRGWRRAQALRRRASRTWPGSSPSRGRPSRSRPPGVEERLARAFGFVEASFGDAQEMLVFTTDSPTSRSGSARYLANNQPGVIPAQHRHDPVGAPTRAAAARGRPGHPVAT